jgi:hypothetical protein
MGKENTPLEVLWEGVYVKILPGTPLWRMSASAKARRLPKLEEACWTLRQGS